MANLITIGPNVESQPLNDNFAALNSELAGISTQGVYPLPLAAGMTDYNTIDSGYACIIFRRGRMVTVTFMLTKDSGNFSGNELFATLPAGLRPAGRCKFSAALYSAPNPTQGTSTFVGMADGTVYVGGEMRVNPHSMTGNRIGGTITFAI